MADSLLRWKYTVFYKTFVSSFTLTVFWLISLFRYWKNQHMYTNTYKFNSFSPPQVNVPPTLPHTAATVHPKDITYCIKLLLFFLKKRLVKKAKFLKNWQQRLTYLQLQTKKTTSPPPSGYIPKYHWQASMLTILL